MLWNPEDCIAAFPAKKSHENVQQLKDIYKEVVAEGYVGKQTFSRFVGKPQPVDSPPEYRMKEMWAERKELCIYNEEDQEEMVLHFPMAHKGDFESRLLVHFYAFLFFQVSRDASTLDSIPPYCVHTYRSLSLVCSLFVTYYLRTGKKTYG